MKNIHDYLKRLDFSEIEAKLYIILLKCGSLSVADLAQKADINRTAAYNHINALLKKGVISQSKGLKSKISANPPAHLHYLVDKKISSINELRDALDPIVTLLNNTYMRQKKEPDSETKYYKGRTSIRVIYNELLKSNLIRSYFNPADIYKILPENEGIFETALLNNPHMKIYEIVEDSTYARKRIKERSMTNRHYWKLLPEDIKLTANDILMYDGKVAIINIGDKDNITGVVLENTAYYNNSVQLFDLLWRLLPTSDF